MISIVALCKNLILALIFLGGYIILGELGARIFFPDCIVRSYAYPDENLGNIMKANQNYYDVLGRRDYTYHVRTNEYGLRMDQRVEPSSRVKKVLFMGNSFVFGWGVEITESFYGILRGGIAGEFKNIEFLNGGSGGYSTGHVYKALRRFSKMFQFDTVIYFMSENDLKANISQLPSERVFSFAIVNGKVRLQEEKVYSFFKRFLYKRRLYVWFNQHSYLFNFIKKQLFSEETAELTDNESSLRKKNPQQEQLTINVSLAHVTQLIDYCKIRNIPLLIIWMPSPNELSRGRHDVSVSASFKRALLAELSEKQTGQFFDPTDNLKFLIRKDGLDAKDIRFPDGHFNKVGNNLYAKSVEEYIHLFCKKYQNI